MKKIHISLINWYNVIRMCGVFALEIVAIVLFALFDLMENAIFSIFSPFFGAFVILTLIEIMILLREGINVSPDGFMVVGKNSDGVYEVVHLEELHRINLCDKDKKPIPEDQTLYKNVKIEFLLKDGRTRYRNMTRLPQKYLDKLRIKLNINK